MKTITIAIGPSEAPEPTIWHIVDTRAPKAYDGFGTFEVHEYDGTRTVLIRDSHYTWQTSRYASGMRGFSESDHDEAAIAEAIWNRIRGIT
jgi:hypothetical protein